MTKAYWLAAAAALASASGPAAAATVIASFTGATTADAGIASNSVFGQSFTVNGTGVFANLAFSFLSMHNAQTAGTANAAGTLQIYTVAKDETAADLATDSVGLVGRSTGVANGAYVFGAGVTVTGGTQYFAYATGMDPTTAPLHLGIVGGNPYPGGNYYASYFSSIKSYATTDAGFVLNADAVTDVAAVPEPASWAMMLAGFGAAAAALRRRPKGARIRFA